MKKILFLCGSLVPGRDGVGDYTRRLATTLLANGHEVRIVATHDREVKQLISEQQHNGQVSVGVLRIPFATESSERYNELQRELDGFLPDWISLQYVPYSFNKYGVSSGFISRLSNLKGLPKVQVMFHELWTVPGDIKGIKGYIISALQRWVVRRIGRQLRPAVVHTHLPAYAVRLGELGITARPLPLFTNVVRTAAARPAQADGAFRVVFFSKISFPPPVISFLRNLKEDKEKVAVYLLGGSKEKAVKAAETLRAAVPGIEVVPIGFLSEEELSEHLAAADLAVSPVPLHILGKSSTVAVFFSHNLPVAAPCILEPGEGFFVSELNQAVCTEYSPEAFEQARSAAQNLDDSIFSATRISRRFTEDLQEATTQPAL